MVRYSTTKKMPSIFLCSYHFNARRSRCPASILPPHFVLVFFSSPYAFLSSDTRMLSLFRPAPDFVKFCTKLYNATLVIAQNVYKHDVRGSRVHDTYIYSGRKTFFNFFPCLETSASARLLLLVTPPSVPPFPIPQIFAQFLPQNVDDITHKTSAKKEAIIRKYI